MDNEIKKNFEKLQQSGEKLQSTMQSSMPEDREMVALGEAFIKLVNGEDLTDEEWNKVEPTLTAAYIRKLMRDQDEKKQ